MAPASPHHKLIIYQLLPRLFGNTNTTNKFYGSIEENGCGKFNDITGKALTEIKHMGFTHVWYTGVIEHATMTDYSAHGITPDDPDVVKGRAGSPYAVTDYYDVAPDLAVDVPNRMAEYEALIERTHQIGLKVIIDFVPNHVARTYQSDAKPAGVRDFGEDDDTNQAFSPQNDFYYVPGHPFVVPGGYNPGGDEFQSPLKDRRFDEYPAKGTGDDVHTASPSINNWFETVKINYGADFRNGYHTHFDPIPPVWHKMLDILTFWAAKGIDAFRCDMVELVPIEFWNWITTQMKQRFPDLIFIGEAYNPNEYSNYLFGGNFDYLYDKVGLYDAIKRLTRNEHGASTWEINAVWNHHCRGFDERMLRFMENHDEQRIASRDFAADPWLAVPGIIVTATLANGPVMIYFGQEVGEPAAGASGFSGDDGRTTIFDYWGVAEHQKWVNNGAFDGEMLSEDQKQLRGFYAKLLNITGKHEAITNGKFYELMVANQQSPGFSEKVYMYLRYTESERILVLVNFNRHDHHMNVKLPTELLTQLSVNGPVTFTDLLSNTELKTDDVSEGLYVNLKAISGMLLLF
ncbi:alpha-amylase family protein [Mucilaginibacter sp. Bleaf8]|uniref:alpha-amylase family glycosyl hydrolase n=1 Tax=Mucilaginibacter sp. Bleaf8 TaxID=2834430 RepID=UPI001BCD61D6|nr:alpha-amylase family glycosyl hydrolase [Mucilaginibacter sp. Bleaf8]MBS7562834.1 alpha-amylase family protein [Mucilaginibacter sp. Bleaf8]